jgi:adenylate kinase
VSFEDIPPPPRELRIILVGPPASGKGTQGEILSERYQIPRISTGDMLRAEIAAGSPLGKRAEEYMNSGGLVPDTLVLEVVDGRLFEPDAKRGFILDGFPRTVPQAEALDQLLDRRETPLTAVLALDVPRELLIERASLRRVDKRTGRIYHLKYSLPPPGAELEQRADDREETVIRRLDEYDARTAALLPYYEARGLLYRVNGVGTHLDVTARLLGQLEP